MSKALSNKVKLNDVVSVKQFGAVGDGVTDDTAAIQAALDYCENASNTPTLYLPAGTYKITDSLWFGDKTDATRRTTLYVRGAGMRTYPLSRGDNTNTTAGTMIDATSLTNRPAIVVQGIVGGVFSDFSVLGSGYQQNYDLGLSTRPSTVSSWYPTGHSSGRYNPTCGIAIDPYSGSTPSGGGYNTATGIAYSRIASSNLRFDNVGSFGFVVGFGTSINGQGFLGDSVRFKNCKAIANAYGFVTCGSQNRDVQYENCLVSSVHTAFDTETFGAQAGDLGHIRGGLVGASYRIFNVNVEYNANSATSLYAESIVRVGIVQAINTAMSPGLQMRSCYFKEETDTSWNAKDPLFFPQGGGFTADGCVFFTMTPWASLYGTSGSTSAIIPPRFINCSFVVNQQTGSPNPYTTYRWYVGEYKNISSARPIFYDCKTDMWNGDSTNAASWIDSYNSSGEVVRWTSATLPTRKEVLNYSATQLTDLNGKAYHLKNISTYAQSTYAITNGGWVGNVFTFDTTVPGDFAVNDVLFYGDSSLPLKVTGIASNTITTVSLFGSTYYDTSAGYYGAAGFRITVVNAQFVNSGAITGDITSGSNSITNVTLATTAFKVGDFIGSSTGSLPTNTRITAISGTTLTLSKNATATGTGVVIGNLICVSQT